MPLTLPDRNYEAPDSNPLVSTARHGCSKRTYSLAGNAHITVIEACQGEAEQRSAACRQAFRSQRTAGEGCGGGARRPAPPAVRPPAGGPPAPSICDRKPPAPRPLASALAAGAFTWILGRSGACRSYAELRV